MKKIKTVALAIAAVTTKSPADITSGLTGKTAAQVIEERSCGKTYRTIAKELGKM